MALDRNELVTFSKLFFIVNCFNCPETRHTSKHSFCLNTFCLNAKSVLTFLLNKESVSFFCLPEGMIFFYFSASFQNNFILHFVKGKPGFVNASIFCHCILYLTFPSSFDGNTGFMHQFTYYDNNI